MLSSMRRNRSRRLQLVASPADVRAVTWARVSTTRQEEHGYSLEDQAAQLRAYCISKGLQVVAEHVVAESASKDERRKWDALVAFLRKPGAPRHLVATEVDRLTRSIRDAATLDDLRREGVNIHLVREGEVLGPDSRSS